MNSSGYKLNELSNNSGLRYFFTSSGNKDIVKIIDYSVVNIKHDVIKTENIYNFGFADFDIVTGETTDDVTSNNGDTYKVFYTVLNTIPAFFEKYPDEAIVVSGSDSKSTFGDQCFQQCKKNCLTSDACKNKHRRINVYLGYINKNFADLNMQYKFYGGLNEEIEPYEPYKKYSSVFVTKNK